MYNTIYPSTPLPALLPSPSFFVIVILFSFSFTPAIVRACVYYVRMVRYMYS